MKYNILLLTLIVSILFLPPVSAQNPPAKLINIEGLIMDEQGEPLISATVVLKASPGVGVVTDLNGHFVLRDIPANSVLVFKYLGYNDEQRTFANSQSNVKVGLSQNPNEVNELIVVGRGSARKVSVTGSISTIDPRDLQVPNISLSNMLGGRLPGVISVQRSGAPGSNSEFWINGISTFGAKAGALILIDGVEGDLNNIDPSDLESFSVLKDASATAVYGVRGANGVIVVTTKRGKAGELKINVKINSTMSQSDRMPQYVEAATYARLANEARVVRGYRPIYSDVDVRLFETGLDPDLHPNVNWGDVILKDRTFNNQQNINISGGGQSARYYLSLGHNNQTGLFKQDKSVDKYNTNIDWHRYNFRANIDANITKSTVLGLNLDHAIVSDYGPNVDDRNYLWYQQAALHPGRVPIRFSTGELAGYGLNRDQMTPYALLNYSGFSKKREQHSKVVVTINQDLGMFVKGLTVSALYSSSSYNELKEFRKKIPALYEPRGRNSDNSLRLARTQEGRDPEFSKSSYSSRSEYMEAAINYSRVFGDHRVGGLLHTYRQEDSNSGGSGYASIIPYRYQTTSGRVTYSFKDTYLAEFNVGYSGSENFKRGHQYGWFPAPSIGLVVSNYKFMKEYLPVISFLKLRASYGIVGNDKIGDTRFPYMTTIDKGSNNWGDTWMVGAVGSDYISWEKSKTRNFGVDAKLFNNKLDFVVDFFNKTVDGIYQQRVFMPVEAGSGTPWGNVGSIDSWGMSGSVEWNHSLNRDMSFTLRSNLTFSRNEVTHFEQAGINYPYQAVKGYPWGVKRGLIALGLFKDEEEIKSSPQQQFGNAPMPGDIRYRDANGDGVINTQDEVPLSYADVPQFQYGAAASFTWKSLTVSAFFTGVSRVNFFYGGDGYMPFNRGVNGNIMTIVADQSNRWTPAEYSGDKATENPNARFPRLTYGGNDNNNRLSTFWLANGQYLRLKDVEISYKLTADFLNVIKVKSATFSLFGHNLAVWDKIKLWDPESAADNGSRYPLQRTYTAQVVLQF